MNNNTRGLATRRLTTMAILAALSVILVAIVHFPVFPAVAFLEYDPADIPVLIAGFALGPGAGIAVTLIASVIQGFTVSAQNGIYGIIMHVLATGTYVTVSSLLYSKHKTKKGAALAIASGAAAMVAVMIGANTIVTTYFMMGAVNAGTIGAVWDLMGFIVAFNALKAGVNGFVTFVIYKRISKLLSKLHVK